MELPHFAAFDLMTSVEGRETLRDYFVRYLEIARESGAGFIFESADLAREPRLGRQARLLGARARRREPRVDRADGEASRTNSRRARTPMVLSGCVGPRGDGYKPGATMSVAEAERYHSEQIRVFAETEADMIAAITMNYVEEAIGIVRAADAAEHAGRDLLHAGDRRPPADRRRR